MLLKKQNDFKTNVKQTTSDDGDSCGISELSGREYASMSSMKQKDKDKLGYDVLSVKMEDCDRTNVNLCQLPYAVTQSLMRSMDTDKGWETLASEAEYTFERMQLLSLKQFQESGSPTRCLLWELGCAGYKVRTLYEKLQKAGRRREMQILEEYVKGSDQEAKASSFSKPSSMSSLPSQLSQLKFSSNKSPPESGFSCSGTEVNFNQPSLINQSQAKAAKNYDDKVIPGTLSPGLGPTSQASQSCASHNSPQAFNGSLTSLPGRLQPTESSDQCSGSRSLPSSNHSTASSLTSPTTGADTLKQMLHTSLQQAELAAPASKLPTRLNDIAVHNRVPHSVYNDNVPKASPQKSSGSPQINNMRREEDLAMAVKTVFSYQDMLIATANFNQNNLLGEGNFGRVYKGSLRHMDCAIKLLKAQAASETTDKLNQIRTELTTLLKYQHENILTLYGYALDGPQLCLVYQFLSNGSLEDRLSQKGGTGPLCWERRLNILHGCCKGINFLHTMGDKPLIHGDIKSANILLDQYLEAKIADLGQAKYATGTSSTTGSMGFTHFTMADTSSKLFTTKAYQAPELLSAPGMQTLSIKSDIFALGVVFLEVCSGLKPLDSNRTEYHFLTDYFNQYIAQKHPSEWVSEFKDKNIFHLDEYSFVKVLEQARKCISNMKKLRPDSIRLLNAMKDICTNFSLADPDQSCMSTSSSVQQSSRFTSVSRHLSSSPSSYAPTKQTPQQLQSEKLEHYSQFSNTFDGVSSSRHSESQEKKDLPVPLMLQVAYDNQPERKPISRLSGVLGSQVNRENIPPAGDHMMFINLPSDPKKLAALGVDANTEYPQDISETTYPCDPAKLAVLQEFDKLPTLYSSSSSQYTKQVSTEGQCSPTSLQDNLLNVTCGHFPSDYDTSHMQNATESNAGMSTSSAVSLSDKKKLDFNMICAYMQMRDGGEFEDDDAEPNGC
ncbi:uncharacterized protein LOC131952890 isoform X2 [Physella acuta]|uniref:uncharacterized protein LOC131952890 isoform X2 n=1 Tax=Physella acuta TaxID=109671 RepID=UPI0027DE7CC5|nr:uncharacterized protein LOC131952890 isoform X2 [Physella acuta]